MMYAQSPTYTLRIEFQDRYSGGQQVGMQTSAFAGIPPKAYRFFDGQNGKIGCDEIIAVIKKALQSENLGNATITLERFEHK